MARLTKDDWLIEGFRILSEFAQHKIKILYLCERLQVTRGSFYHHFKSISHYIEELMKKWKQKYTLDFIDQANKGKTPLERLQILNEMIFRNEQAIETAIRSWGFYHETVQTYLQQVDEIRIQYLQHTFIKAGLEEHKALMCAKLEYATFIGIQQMYPKKFDGEVRDLCDLYQELHWSKHLKRDMPNML
ncbi:MAG: TetR/AcrR family transcriptional regulator [Flammeovirgaceae bacterium]